MSMPRTIIGLAALVLAATTACGGAGDNGEDKSLSLLFTNDPWTRAIKPKIPEFEKQTGIQVDLQVLGQEQALSKLLVTLQSRSPAVDLFQSIPSAVGVQYHQAGFYENLNSYVKDPKQTPDSYEFSGFQPGVTKAERIEKDLVGIPILFEGPVVYYRADVLKKYGLKPPETLADLVSVARQAHTKSNGKYVTAVRGQARPMVYLLGNFLHNWGVEWADESGRANFDDPNAVKAIDMYAGLARDYGPKGVVNNTYTQTSALMAQGRAVMAIESSNELQTVAGKESSVAKSLGVMPIPAGPGGSHPTILTKGISMSAFSDNKEAAWRFIRWATSPEMQGQLAEEGVANPRGVSADSSSGSIDKDVYNDWQQSLQTILSEGNPNVGPPVADQTAAREAIGEQVQQVILGRASAGQAAGKIQSSLQTYLKDE